MSNVDSPDLSKLADDLNANMSRLSKYVTTASTLLAQDAFCEAAQTIRDGNISADAVALETFDIQTWNDLCDLKGYTKSPIVDPSDVKLLLSYLQQYSDAEELFRRHRRLSLERAALEDRLDVIYQLKSRFDSPVWTRMIEGLELLRDQQIVESLEHLTEENVTFELMRQYRYELTRPDRVSTPRDQTVEAVQRWYDITARREARENLRQLIADWEGYVQQRNDNRVLECYDRYVRDDMQRFRSLLAKDDRAQLDKLVAYGKELRMHADAIAEYNRKQRAFESILQNEYDIDKIEDAYAALEISASKARLQISPAIVKAYEEKIGAFRRQQQRKRLTLAMGIIGVACLLMAGIVQLAKSVRNHAFAKETTAQLNALVEKFNNVDGYTPEERYEALEQARKLVEERQNDKRLRAYKEWESTFKLYDQTRGKEEKRHEEFLRAADELNAFIKNRKPSETKKRELINRAKSPEEKKQLDDILAYYDEALTGGKTPAYKETLDTIKQIYDRVKPKNVTLKDAEKDFRDARRLLSSLESREKSSGNSSPTIPEQYVQERESLTRLFDQLEMDKTTEALTNDLVKAIPDEKKYLGTLAQGVNAFDQAREALQAKRGVDQDYSPLVSCSQRSSDLQNAQNAMTSHQVIEQWNETMKLLRAQQPWNLDEVKFQEARNAWTTFTRNARQYTRSTQLIPEWRTLDASFQSPQKSAGNNGDSRSWGTFSEALGAYHHECFVRRDNKAMYYYFTKKKGGDRYTNFAEPEKSSSSSEDKRKTKGEGVESASYALACIVKEANSNPNDDSVYLQTVLKCLEELDKLSPNSSDNGSGAQSNATVTTSETNDAETNDPILVLCLFKLVLDNAPKKQFQEWHEWIESRQEPFDFTVNPFDLDPDKAEDLREVAMNFLRNRPKTLPQGTELPDSTNDVVLWQYVWVGLLDVDDSDEFEVKESAALASDNSERFVLDASEKILVSIGKSGDDLKDKVKDKKINVRRWTPVYARVVLKKE
ncbi:MAG: hypothetical protein Q4G03_09095 [Planctomycetia bacterium]|nr:hypothetical protein [Planctomycetia bacterium]